MSTDKPSEPLQRLIDRLTEPCPYCSDGKRTGLPSNACENCMNTGLKHPELLAIMEAMPVNHPVTGGAMTDVDLIKRLRQLGVYDPRWKKDAYTYFSHSGGRTHMGRVSEFFKEAVALAESAADALERKAR